MERVTVPPAMGVAVDEMEMQVGMLRALVVGVEVVPLVKCDQMRFAQLARPETVSTVRSLVVEVRPVAEVVSALQMAVVAALLAARAHWTVEGEVPVQTACDL